MNNSAQFYLLFLLMSSTGMTGQPCIGSLNKFKFESKPVGNYCVEFETCRIWHNDTILIEKSLFPYDIVDTFVVVNKDWYIVFNGSRIPIFLNNKPTYELIKLNYYRRTYLFSFDRYDNYYNIDSYVFRWVIDANEPRVNDFEYYWFNPDLGFYRIVNGPALIRNDIKKYIRKENRKHSSIGLSGKLGHLSPAQIEQGLEQGFRSSKVVFESW